LIALLLPLQDDLWGNAILLKEANAISVELKKKASDEHSTSKFQNNCFKWFRTLKTI